MAIVYNAFFGVFSIAFYGWMVYVILHSGNDVILSLIITFIMFVGAGVLCLRIAYTVYRNMKAEAKEDPWSNQGAGKSPNDKARTWIHMPRAFSKPKRRRRWP